jgi:DNA/RNA-binding domain of Phe-tRNA-synthetase-like protein
MKKAFSYTISSEIFQSYPGYVRGVVVAEGLNNPPSSARLIAMLRSAEAVVRQEVNSDSILNHPRFASWREAYRAFGARPGDYRPSVEAMTRRLLKNQELPSINTLVDIGNITSLLHLVPTGGHAIDNLKEDISLCKASGEEIFIPLDGEESEHPAPGEVIFVEGKTVLTRRWTWRQGVRTLLLPSTTAVEFNVDGLSPVSQVEVEQICMEIIDLIQTYCGGSSRFEILTPQSPTMILKILA